MNMSSSTNNMKKDVGDLPAGNKKLESAYDPQQRLETEEVNIVIEEDGDALDGSNDCPIEKQLSLRRMTSSMRDSKNTGYCYMICGPKYRKGTLICVGLMFFNQWSGATPIMMFMPRLID